MKKPANPKHDKVYIVIERLDSVSYVGTVFSTKKAAAAQAKYFKKQRPGKNWSFEIQTHDVYMGFVPDEKAPK